MLSRLLRKSVAKTKAQTRRSVQHSPFNQNIVNTKELRSEIFASRRRIPGRKVKFLVLISTAGFIFGQAKFREINGYFQLREQEQTRLQRRSVPFFQAMDDLRWMALEDRLSLVNEALFQDKSKEWFDSVTKRYHFQEDQFWYVLGFFDQG